MGKPNLGAENGSGMNGDREKGCMCCEMDRAFEEVSSCSLDIGNSLATGKDIGITK